MLVSCGPDQNEMAVLDQVIEDYVEQNLSIFERILTIVEEEGNRPVEVEILNLAEEIVNVGRFNDSLSFDQILDSQFIMEQKLVFPDSLFSEYSRKELKSIRSKYQKRKVEIERSIFIADEFSFRLHVINFLQLKRNYLDHLLKMVSNCTWFTSVHLSINNDIAINGQPFRGIISLSDSPTSDINYSYKNLEIILDNTSMAFDSEQIGSSLIITFIPNQIGTHVITGELVRNFKSSENSLSTDFHFEIPVK